MYDWHGQSTDDGYLYMIDDIVKTLPSLKGP